MTTYRSDTEQTREQQPYGTADLHTQADADDDQINDNSKNASDSPFLRILWWFNLIAVPLSAIIFIVSLTAYVSAQNEREALEQEREEAQLAREQELAAQADLIAELTEEEHPLREDAERFRDRVPGCEDTRIVFTDPQENNLSPDIAAEGRYDGVHHRTHNAIELNAELDVNQYHLNQIIVHECAHVLQAAVYNQPGDWTELREVTYEIYGDVERDRPLHPTTVENNSQGLEQHADCIAYVWHSQTYSNSWESLNYVPDPDTTCSGDGWTAAEQVLNGERINLEWDQQK
ncbi:hypothetical protein [Nesterenkonia alba]|uniref:hypothetical protein n=1 Tax=Nesterenkonia alba TaxID=515814 RepID=UPI0003B6BE9D|nr:hypothetical protein [Nesterenkonia alba]